MDIPRRIVPHALQIKILQDVQRLQHHRSLRPLLQLENVNPLICRHQRLLDQYLPAGQVLHGDEPALLPATAGEFQGDVTGVKTVIRHVDRFFSRFAAFQGLPFDIH